MDSNRSAGRSLTAGKEAGPDLVVAAEVVHRHQKRRNVHQVSSVELDSGQDLLDFDQDRLGLELDVEVGGTDIVNLGPDDRVVSLAGAGTRYEHQPVVQPKVRE